MSRIAVLRRIPLTVAAVGVAVVLSACGQATDATPAANAPAGDMASMNTSSSEGSESANEADVTFAQMMILDHKMVAQMAKLAEQKAASDDLKALAPQLRKGQSKTATMLQGMLKDWDATASADMAGMEMPGSMSTEDMATLKSLKGMDFDMMFAQMMVKHHEASIEMARDEQAKGTNAEAKTMAADMVTEQQAQVEKLLEIAKM